MEIGFTFPQTEIGSDPDRILRFARAVEDHGFRHLMAYDHVVGADWKARNDPGTYPYDHEVPFHEPFVLFGFLASQVRLHFVTGILILPQRQTALVAKQAATLDVLSGGRIRLGVGVGWNHAEYQALGEDFHTRGARYDEQIQVLRRLFTEDVVTFRGRFHDLDHVGILPLPTQRPIPIWLGGNGEGRVLERIGRLADGWMGMGQDQSREEFEAKRAIIRSAAEDAGRDPASVQFQRSIALRDGDNFEPTLRILDGYRELGVDFVSITAMRAGRTPEEHVDVVGRLGEALNLS